MNARDAIPGLAALSERLTGFSAKRRLPRWRRDVFASPGCVPCQAASHQPDGNLGGEGTREVALLRRHLQHLLRAREPARCGRGADAGSAIAWLPLARGGRRARPCAAGARSSPPAWSRRRAPRRAGCWPLRGRSSSAACPSSGSSPPACSPCATSCSAMLPGEEAERWPGRPCSSRSSWRARRRPAAFPKPIAAPRRQGRAARPLPPEGVRRHGRGQRGAGAGRGPRGRDGGVELLRHGRRLRLRRRHPRGLAGHGRALPAAGRAPGAADAIIAADGFSCRHQIHDGTGRTPLHVARILRQRHGRGRRARYALVTMRRGLRPMAAPRPVDACGGRKVGLHRRSPTTIAPATGFARACEGFVGGTHGHPSAPQSGGGQRVHRDRRSTSAAGSSSWAWRSSATSAASACRSGSFRASAPACCPRSWPSWWRRSACCCSCRASSSDGDRLEPGRSAGPSSCWAACSSSPSPSARWGLVVAGPLAVIVSALADKDTRPVEVAILGRGPDRSRRGLLFKELLSLPIPFDPRRVDPGCRSSTPTSVLKSRARRTSSRLEGHHQPLRATP